MSLLPPQATFAEVVQEAFLRLRGKGLMLGALDTELLRAWAETGVPAEVVVRGLERAAARTAWDAPPGESGPRSLRACRPEVEAELEGYRARVLGAGALHQDTGQLVEELRALAAAQPRFAKVVEQLWAAGVLARANPRDAVAAALVRKMPFAERLTLLREERRQMVEERASPRARSMLRRRVRAALAASELGLTAL